MTDATSRFGPPIDLASEADFILGVLQVSPSTREVIHGEARETLEPRVMQVLVALAQAGSRVISRDELIARCWEGRIVGEDAINRAISRLRRLSEVDREASFQLETIPRVGYRLLPAAIPPPPTSIENAVPAPSAPETAAPRFALQSVVMRHRLVIAVTVAVIVAAATTWLLRPTIHPSVSQNSVVIPPVLPNPTGASIAVLPFLNLSPDKDQEFFSDGITEEITSALAKVPGLTVIGRTSAFQFKGENRDMRAIGRALGAKNLIEGSVRKDGDEVRISARLVRVADGADLWTESYDRKLTDIFAIQEEIATSIAGALQVPLGLRPGQNLVSNRTTDTVSYEAYLRAIELMRGRGFANMNAAKTLLEQAVARDPNYAPNWGQLANIYGYLAIVNPLTVYRPGDARRQTRDIFLPKAEATARKAIALDVNTPDAWTALGQVQGQHRDLIQAEDSFKRALQLDPKNALALHLYAHYLAGAGRLKEALPLRRQVAVLDPLSRAVQDNLAKVLALNGQYVAAMAIKNRDLPQVAEIEAAAGRFKEAADTLLKIPSEPYPKGMLETAARILRAAPMPVASPQELPALHPIFNFVYLYVGAESRALEYSEAEVKGGYISVELTTDLWYPAAAPLRRTERFKALMRNAGYVDYWRARGWPDLCHPVGADDFACN